MEGIHIANNVLSVIKNYKPFGCAGPPDPSKNTAFIDTAASVSILGERAVADTATIQQPNLSLNTPSQVPIFTSSTLKLKLNRLLMKALQAFRVGNIPHNLVAVSTLVDAGCSVHFYHWGFDIDLNGETIYKGWRDQKTRLFQMSLVDDNTPNIVPDSDDVDFKRTDGMIMSAIQWSVNSIYECQNKEQLVKYFHASFGSHVKSTLSSAARAGYLQGCPGFTQESINKYIMVEDATEMGHMTKSPAGARSTTTQSKRGRKSAFHLEQQAAANDAMALPEQEPGNKKTHLVFMTAKLANDYIASDQTGAYPRTSSRGCKYICVFYIYDANCIKGIPVKSRHSSELLRAYQTIYKWCERRGFKPSLHRLDNETSQEVEDFIATQKTDMQYSAPGRHCAPAEKAVQTYKACFKSTTASLPPEFPIAYWCRLLPQIDLSVNIVRACRQNPKLSAWAATEGDFHFDSTPIAPPGTAMLMYERPENRSSFGHNAKKAWYIGPCLDHYRTFKGILPSTGKERMSDTVKMKHHAIAIPSLTPADRILEAAKQLDRALKQLPKAGPLDELKAIAMLREVLLGERTEPLLSNSLQKIRQQQRVQSQQVVPTQANVHKSKDNAPENRVNARIKLAASPAPTSPSPNYISDDDDESQGSEDDDWDIPPSQAIPGQGSRRSKRVLSQLRQNEKNGLERIASLAAWESAVVPDLSCRDKKYANSLSAANNQLQMSEWAFEAYFAGAIIDEITGQPMEYRDLMKDPARKPLWQTSLANEIGRLAQGIRDLKGTNTLHFIPKSEIPADRFKDITYARIVVAYKPDKLEKNRARITVGGDRINSLIDCGTPTADVPIIKLLWNSTLSTPKAKFFTMDISNFYLGTPMERPEYMRMPLSIMPQEIIEQYNLLDIAKDGWVYIKIVRGMYGLPQAGIIANDLLQARLKEAGYHQCQFTPGLYKHAWRPITFTLVVDDFGVKFVGEQHANHLKKTLEHHYDITVDWTGSKYVGISLKWDYENRTLDTSVPGFVNKTLHKLHHPKPSKPQHAPAKATPIKYGSKVQTATPADNSPVLSDKEIKRIQEAVGAFAWYSRSTDPTMAKVLSSIAARQATATEQVKAELHQFLDYCSTHPDSKVRYIASDMTLALHSDASHLSEPHSKSRAGGHFYLTRNNAMDLNNGAILTLSKIIKHVVGSASESEVAALFYNCKAAVPLRIALQEMGHQQPSTPVITDNSTAEGLINRTMVPKKAKSYDLRFNWLKCREAQKQFSLIWKKGKLNRADFHTKNHPIHTYKQERSKFVLAPAA